MLLEKIRDLYNKTIILINDDSEILYKYTSNLIIKKNFHALLIFIGSILFVASDFCLLLELFTDLGYKWGHGCMALYFPA